jgi:hypothetical protein
MVWLGILSSSSILSIGGKCILVTTFLHYYKLNLFKSGSIQIFEFISFKVNMKSFF